MVAGRCAISFLRARNPFLAVIAQAFIKFLHLGGVAMEITEVRFVPADKDRLRAYVTITLDHCLEIRGLKLVRSKKGYLVSMPSRKKADGTYVDIAAPITFEARKMLEERVLAEYEKITGESLKK
jgi:stage V sporulation protein G